MIYRRLFLKSAAAILFATSIIKLVSAGGAARSLSISDPVLVATNQQVFLVAGLLELALAGFLIFGKNVRLQLIALAWLTTNFAAYRLVLWWGNFAKPCSCLGNAMDWWPWLMKHQDSVMKGLLTFMLVGAYGLLWHDRRAVCEREEKDQEAVVE